MGGLLNLPNELLLLVFVDLDETTLCSLAILSRRVHFLALSVYFSRHGILDLEVSKSLDLCDDKMDALHGLRISLFITGIHLKRIVCKFNYKQKDKLLNQVSGVARLITKLASVEEVTLDFANVHHWILRFGQISAGLREWTRAFEGLLDLILGKSCRNLTVRHGRLFLQPYQHHDIQKAIANRYYLGKLSLVDCPLAAMRKLGEDTSSQSNTRLVVPSQNSYSPPSVNNILYTSLTSFTAHSSMLFHPPCLYWTLHTLNIASITDLSFEHLDLTPEAWSAILPWLTLPALSNFKIAACSIEFADFSIFASRHPSITSLTLAEDRGPMQHGFDLLPFPKAALPRLTTLTASHNYVSHLLKISGTFPCLAFISIATRVPLKKTFDLAEVESVLCDVAHRVRRTVLSLKIRVDSISADWLDRDARSGTKALLGHVTCIELSAGWYLLAAPDAIGLLPNWLALFPRLQQISFAGRCLSWMSLDAKQDLIQSINNTCPQVETVVFDEKVVNTGLSTTLPA